jgi:hypothetical protein
MKLSQEKQQWDHARSDWEHWRSRVQDEMETAQVGVDENALTTYVHVWLQAAACSIYYMSTGRSKMYSCRQSHVLRAVMK